MKKGFFDDVILTRDRVVVVFALIILPGPPTGAPPVMHAFVWNGFTKHVAWGPGVHYVLSDDDCADTPAGAALRKRFARETLQIAEVRSASAVRRASPSAPNAIALLPPRLLRERETALEFVREAKRRPRRGRAFHFVQASNERFPVKVLRVGGANNARVVFAYRGETYRGEKRLRTAPPREFSFRAV